MSQAQLLTRSQPETQEDSVRVLIVDDSAVVRGFIARWLESESDIRVVATASSGDGALAMLRTHNPDVIVLDIEMPGMDGIEALPKLIAIQPHVQIIMASTLTVRNAEISMRALELGAMDYIAKPRTSLATEPGVDFKHELIEKVRVLGGRARQLGRRPSPAVAPVRAATKEPGVRKIQAPSLAAPKILAIGSSTGGPQALFEMLGRLIKPFPLPVVITQHMPATFTAILAQHITRLTGFAASEAAEGMRIAAGHVYVAPGDRHLLFARNDEGLVARITTDPPVNFCRPAVDPMFASLASLLGPAVLGVILTGMGRDGTDGARDVVAAGGAVVSQDEETSVVWGMPRAVAQAGLSSFIGPLDALAERINATISGKIGR